MKLSTDTVYDNKHMTYIGIDLQILKIFCTWITKFKSTPFKFCIYILPNKNILCILSLIRWNGQFMSIINDVRRILRPIYARFSKCLISSCKLYLWGIISGSHYFILHNVIEFCTAYYLNCIRKCARCLLHDICA